jgi:hypothetical protein
VICRLFSAHLPRPPWSVFNSDYLAAEPCDKLLSVGFFSEAPTLDVFAIAHEHMTTRTER